MHQRLGKTLGAFAAVLLGISPALARASAQAQEPSAPPIVTGEFDDAQFAISDPQGTVIGEQYETVTQTAKRAATSRKRKLEFSIDGHDPVRQFVSISTVNDALTGAPAMLWMRYENAQTSGSYTIDFGGNTAKIRHKAGKETREYTQIITPGLPLHDPELISVPAPSEFYAFDLGTGKLVKRRSRIFAASQSASPNISEAILTYAGDDPVNIWLVERGAKDGPKGELIAMIRPQVGSSFIFRPHDPDSGPVQRSQFGKISHPMLASPNTISEAAKQRQIRYRIAMLDPLAKAVPQTPEQRAQLTPTGFKLDVCTGCGAQFAADAASLEKWRQPSAWVQSDHPAIAKAAARVAEQTISDADKLERLSRIVRRRLKDIDLNGHYSARSAWERRAGDCTEDAVLLAALARAAGIPARIASGIAYTRERYHGTRNAFIPHTWIIAYTDGEWRSFDMTTQEGFGAGHIALTIGDGEAHSIAAANLIAGMIEWESLSQVRRRPED